MFREMNVIAAVAYAAEQAAGENDGRLWSELDETQRSMSIQRVMRIMRGETSEGIGVFETTVRAILAGPNADGHGELALEDIAKLGDFMLNAGLLTADEAMKGGSIVGHALGLLEQLATIRSMFVPFEAATDEEAEAAAADKADELASDSEPTLQ